MSHLRHYNSKDKVLVAVDSVIFGFENKGLKILLIKRDFEPQKGSWSLIGGFLRQKETLDQAANRVLNELTGLDDIYMEQLFSYSAVDRDPVDRTISVAFFALINIEQYDFKLNKEHHAHWDDDGQKQRGHRHPPGEGKNGGSRRPSKRNPRPSTRATARTSCAC